MAFDLLLVQSILGRLVQPRCRSCISAAKAYRKVLKHRQLEMFQFRTVSQPTAKGSLGKEIGKLLGDRMQRSDNSQGCFSASFAHLMYMDEGSPCDEKPCRIPGGDGVCLS